MTTNSVEPAAAWDAVDDDLTTALEHLRRALHVKDADLHSTLAAVAAEAVRTVAGAEYCGVNLVVRGKFIPQATHGVPPDELDVFQQATGVGPCVESAREQSVIFSRAMSTEQRWADFAALALRLGVRSMLCVPMRVDDTQFGSLSLYGTRDDAFGSHDESVARLFALHATIAIADARRVDNLQTALRSRDVIGQAKGILMERRRLTADQAFEVLARESQRANRKLADVAEAFVLSGELP